MARWRVWLSAKIQCTTAVDVEADNMDEAKSRATRNAAGDMDWEPSDYPVLENISVDDAETI